MNTTQANLDIQLQLLGLVKNTHRFTIYTKWWDGYVLKAYTEEDEVTVAFGKEYNTKAQCTFPYSLYNTEEIVGVVVKLITTKSMGVLAGRQ